MTPWQIVEAATIAPARYLGKEKEQGTVAVGQRADLLLLEGNPLEDPAQIFHSAGVMVNGRWLPRAELVFSQNGAQIRGTRRPASAPPPTTPK
jgi:imidazolonepropionase-like amidohydrolase